MANWQKYSPAVFFPLKANNKRRFGWQNLALRIKQIHLLKRVLVLCIFYFYFYFLSFKQSSLSFFPTLRIAQLAGPVEYTDCFAAER